MPKSGLQRADSARCTHLSLALVAHPIIKGLQERGDDFVSIRCLEIQTWWPLTTPLESLRTQLPEDATSAFSNWATQSAVSNLAT
jgi:hypothetical protein